MSSLSIAGDTSGSVTLQAPAVAGTTVVTLPSTSMNLGTGGGSVATNTAFGTSALGANTSGATNTVIGYQAGYSNTTGFDNVAIGYKTLYSNTTGAVNTAIGSGVTGSWNAALYANTTGIWNTALGAGTLSSNTTASNNTGLGGQALLLNTTGASNTAVGKDSLYNNTTASNNTAVGYQAGYSNTIGASNSFFGFQAGYSNAGTYNTFVGYQAGYAVNTYGSNTFIGAGAGSLVTTGYYNTILGGYNGNQGGLDIRTSSNYIVLSDGQGNPRGYFDNNGYLRIAGNAGTNRHEIWQVSGGAYAATIGSLNATAANCYGLQLWYTNATPNNTGNEFLYCNDSTSVRAIIRSNGGLANFSANNANLSDRREKTNFAPAKSYLDVICAIPVQTFNYIDQNMEEDGGLTLGVVAQDVQEVAPELVMESNWGSKEEPKMRLSIYQTDLQYALMKSIQELKALVDAQATEIAELKAKL